VKNIFQPLDGFWQHHASLGTLRSVIDPKNVDNRKNKYIHLFHKQAIKSILPDIKNLNVLDFGCGTGRFSLLLSRKAHKVINVDITFEMIEIAKQRSTASNIYYGMIDGSNLPLKDTSIDFIVSVWVLQYAAREKEVLRKIIEEFTRVLKPEGKIFALEQASFADENNLLPECTLRLDNYLNVLEKYFLIRKSYPIRGARKRSFIQKLANKGRVPELFFPLFTYFESKCIRRSSLSELSKYPYVDYVFHGILK